jgi:hypothetical protein
MFYLCDVHVVLTPAISQKYTLYLKSLDTLPGPIYIIIEEIIEVMTSYDPLMRPLRVRGGGKV